VAEGVYVFTTTPYAEVGFCGNIAAVVTSEGVLVFDSGARPETAQTIIGEIRKLPLNKTLPNVTFSDQMTLHRGERENPHSACTCHDSRRYLYFSAEGKDSDHRRHRARSVSLCHRRHLPVEWLSALKEFVALQPSAVIPGLGLAQVKEKLIDDTISLLEEALRQTRDNRARGMTLDQNVAAVQNNSRALATIVGITGADDVNAFKGYFLEMFTRRAYRELDGPLGDLPDGIQ
jgi:hypothetical protein